MGSAPKRVDPKVIRGVGKKLLNDTEARGGWDLVGPWCRAISGVLRKEGFVEM